MNKEKIYNLFVIFQNNILYSIGYVLHEVSGNDTDKINFLHSNLFIDFKNMNICKLPTSYTIIDQNGNKINGISLESYNSMLHNGTSSVIFEDIFKKTNAPATPLNITTPVVDGNIKIHKTIELESAPKGPPVFEIHEINPEYYLSKYITNEGFDMNQLIVDDFVKAIQILFNNGNYVSCLKLFMSAIDTISFLEYGDIKDENIFEKWLTKFTKLEILNLTAKELWEFRNSLLHMTNPYSRKVLKNEVNPLQFYVSQFDRPELQSNIRHKYFNLRSFIDVITDGFGNWTQSFNHDKSKFESFVDRYDMILSDSRYNQIKFENP